VSCALADREKAQCTIAGYDFSPVVFSDRFNRSLIVLAFVAIVKIVTTLVSLIMEVYARRLRLVGKAMLRLRANIFTTMLQMSDVARSKFDTGDIEKCLDTEVDTAVRMVWLNAFELLRELAGLALKLLLAIQITVGLDASRSTGVLLACIPVMALIAFVVFFMRRRALLQLHATSFTREENWAAFVAMSVGTSPLIRSYQRGWRFTEWFRKCHAIYNNAAFEAVSYSAHTVNLLKGVFVLVSAVVLLVGGSLVREGNLDAGEFLVLLRTIDGFGSDIIAASRTFNDVVYGSAAVRKIATVLNAESWRLELRRRRTLKQDLEHKASDEQIHLRGVHYMYPDMQAGQSFAIAPLDLTIPTGDLVCFPGGLRRGGQGSSSMIGINTLLHLIAGRLQPSMGEVQVPGNWRVVYVPVLPMMFDGTLMYNLLFSDHARPELAWGICEELGMSPGLIGRADLDVGTDGQCLTLTDRLVVSLARAILHGVDVLLISSALDVLGEEHGAKVLRFLRRYCIKRGYAENEFMPLPLRHPKTVLYTSKFRMLQDQATLVVRKAETSRRRVGSELVRSDASWWSTDLS